MNIHQLPFCEEIISHVGEKSFRFVANSKMDADRMLMSFEDMNVTKPFVVRAYEGGSAYEEACRLALESDVAIFGSASQPFQQLRLAENMLSFRYNERIFKQGFYRLLDPRIQKRYRSLFTQYRNKELYVLCAGAYTRLDLRLLGFPSHKCYKWGYFPEMKVYPSFNYLRAKKTGFMRPGVSILWAGRLVGWKHPDVAIFIAKDLKEAGVEFSMNIIGGGSMLTMLEQKVADFGLSENVHLLGAQSHDFVLEEMEKADIFLFTSDRNEGWGAVLNEAMNAGCAVVTDKHIGSAPFLIEDGHNGILYSGKVMDLSEKVLMLTRNESLRTKMGLEAWETINHKWDIKTATANLFTLIEDLKNHRAPSVLDGPCSLA